MTSFRLYVLLRFMHKFERLLIPLFILLRMHLVFIPAIRGLRKLQLLKHSTFLDHPVPVVKILVRTRKQAVVSTCVPTPGALDTPMTLTFDLLTSGSVHAKVLSRFDFGADSSSRFPFRERTNRQTDRQTDMTELPTPRRRLYSWRGVTRGSAAAEGTRDAPGRWKNF